MDCKCECHAKGYPKVTIQKIPDADASPPCGFSLGYTCSRCYAWVPFGNMHYCSNTTVVNTVINP